MYEDDVTEEQGFDEREEIDDDERVVLEIDGVRRSLILLAVIEVGEREYAVLGSESEDEQELLVARYDAEGSGDARFSRVQDAAELEVVRAALSDLIDLEG